MIKSFRLQNFKAFEDTGALELKGLNVLAGPNSGGKSSILQSLLLLKQTLDGPPEIDLNIDGRYLQFSGFNELTFGKPSLSRCSVGFSFDVNSSFPPEMFSFYFPDIAIPEEGQTVSVTSTVDLTFRYKKRNEGAAVLLDTFQVLSRAEGIEESQLRGVLKQNNYHITTKGGGRWLPEEFANRRIRTVAGRHFMPHVLVLEGEEDNSHVLQFPLNPIFTLPFRELAKEIEDNIKYLGPLRERPQRAYLHSGNPMTEIGDSGEYAAQILWLEKDRKVTYLPSLYEETREISLMAAVNDAFLNLGMSQPANVKSEKSVMYQILFQLGGSKNSQAVTIADVGFGVSQLLPILVLGLRSDESSILLLEQPEIHLHPKLQANLADFLLTLAAQGRRIVVETHSDHFINRLRRRIAEDPSDELRNKVNIWFVQPPEEGIGASIEPLRVDSFGVIENWPPGFLPESTDEAEAIFLAGLVKRRV